MYDTVKIINIHVREAYFSYMYLKIPEKFEYILSMGVPSSYLVASTN